MARLFHLDRVTLDLALIATAAGFGSFGAVASLAEVAHHFGHAAAGAGNTFTGVVGLSGTTLGLGLAVLRGASLVALPLASLADRFGRRPVLVRTAIWGLALTAAAALSPTYWIYVCAFALARPLLTAATTVVQVLCVELSAEAIRVYRIAWIAAGSGVGAGLSAIIHGVLPGSEAFRYLCAMAIIPALLIRPLLARIPEPSTTQGSVAQIVAGKLGAVPREYLGKLAIVATLTVVLGIITGPANGFAFVYAESVLKISRHEVALVVALSAFTGLAGLVAGRYLADHVGRRGAFLVGAIATALTSTVAYSGGQASFVLGYMTGVFAAAVFAPAGSALINETFPHTVRATVGGWVIVAGVVGAILGLLLFGYVGDVAQGGLAINALRVPAIVTFLPLLPLLGLLRWLPETKGHPIE